MVNVHVNDYFYNYVKIFPSSYNTNDKILRSISCISSVKMKQYPSLTVVASRHFSHIKVSLVIS